MSTTARPTPHLPDWLVQNRNFVLLWAAYGVAAFGDHLSEMALLRERGGLHRDDSTRVQALMTCAFFLPFAVLGPLAGWWCDRFSRRTTMIAADLFRAALAFNMAYAVTALARALPPAYGDFSIVIPLGVIGTLAAFFSPARQAMLPTLIRDDQLVRANAMISALGTIGAILSAVVGGYLVQHLGPQWNYHANTATFALSAAFVAGIAMSRTRAVPHPPLTGVWTPLKDGFRYVRSHAPVLQLILLGTVYWAAAGVVISVTPAIAKLYFGENYTAAGTYRGVLALGLASGATVMTILGPALPISLAFLIGLGSAAGWVLLLAATVLVRAGPVPTGIALFGMGGAGAAILVTIMACLQRFVPDSRRGRVFGVSDQATMAAIAAATGLLGLPHIEHIDRYVPWLLAGVGAALALTTAFAWRAYRRGSPYRAVLWLVWRMVEFYAAYWFRVRRTGRCTVPRSGPVILAANHTAGIDPLLILATCTYRPTSFLVAKEYCRGWAGWFVRLIDCIPVDRAQPGKSSLDACLSLLERGGCLGIFPQGIFEEPGQALAAKPGVGLIALRSHATVVPCHISGVRYSPHTFGTFFTRHKARVTYGRPIDLAAYRDGARDRETIELVSERILAEIRALAP